MTTDHKPLTAADASEMIRSRMVCCDNDCEHLILEPEAYTWHCAKFGSGLDRTGDGYEEHHYEAFRCSACLLSTLSMLQPPTDAEVQAAVERLENLRQTRHLALTPIEQEAVWSYLCTLLAALREEQGEKKHYQDRMQQSTEGAEARQREIDALRAENTAQAEEIKRLREEVAEALRRFAQDCPTCTDTVHNNISDLTRRLAGAEAQLASREQELLDTLNRLVDERGTLRGKAEAAEAEADKLRSELELCRALLTASDEDATEASA